MKALPQGLVVATNNAIYMSEKPKRNETYGPTNWKMKIISEEGANRVKPVYIDGKLYYINARGDKLLSLSYSLEADTHKPAVESILSEHLFQYGIKEIAFARSPIQVLWLISNSGDLISGVILDSKNKKLFSSIDCLVLYCLITPTLLFKALLLSLLTIKNLINCGSLLKEG